MRSFLEGVGVADDPVAQRAGVPGGAAPGSADLGGGGGRHQARRPHGPRSWRRRVLWRPGRQPQRRHRLGQRPRARAAVWRARVTRGYAVIFRRGWGSADPVAQRAGSRAVGARSRQRLGGSGGRIRLVDLTVRDLGGGGFCGGRAAASAAAPTRSAAPSRPRGGWRARVTRGYAVIFRRGWGSARPRSSAGGVPGVGARIGSSAAAAAGSGSSTSRSATLAAAGSVAARAAASAAAPTRCAPSRPRGGWRARVTRGYAVIFRRGWGSARPRSSAGGVPGVAAPRSRQHRRQRRPDQARRPHGPRPWRRRVLWRRGRQPQRRHRLGARPRARAAARRARITRGYAVIFRRGWGSDRPRSSAGGVPGVGGPDRQHRRQRRPDQARSTSRSATLAAAGSVAARGGSLSGGTDSVRALAPARRLESEDNAGLCGHF